MTEIITPVSLWKDFRSEGLPLNVSVVRDGVRDGRGERELYFTAACYDGGIVRAFARLFYHKAAGKRPVVIFATGAGRQPILDEILRYYSAGFNVLCPDYSGKTEDAARFTLYPDSRAFSNYSPQTLLFEAPQGAKDSCWYDWVVIMRRAVLCALETTDCDGVAFVGKAEGAHLAWILAATEPSISCAAALSPTQLLASKPSGDEGETSDARANYLAALAPRAYAQNITKPFLCATATNDEWGAFERVSENLSRIPSTVPVYLTAAPRLINQLFRQNFDTVLAFLAQFLGDGIPLPQRPVLEARISESRLYYSLTVDASQPVAKIRIMGAQGEQPELRFWQRLKTDKLSDEEYIAKADATDEGNYLAFASVEYDGGVLLTSPLLTRNPAALGAVTAQPDKARLIYESKMCADGFVSKGSTSEVNDGVCCESGPLGIKGVTVCGDGTLSTNKVCVPKYVGEAGARLQVTFYTAQPRTFSVSVEERQEKRTRFYSVAQPVQGAEFWQKLTLGLSDFKTTDGAMLPCWDDVVCLSFDGAAGLVISNILWI